MPGTGQQPGGSRLWPPSYLRYLLVVPAIRAYRRKTRTRLAWRLAGSHFSIVLWSVLAISILVLIGSAIVVEKALPDTGEASLEALEIALIIENMNDSTAFTPEEMNVILKGITTGAIAINLLEHDTAINAQVGPKMSNIRSISLGNADGVIVSSSDPELVGRAVADIDPIAGEAAATALTGSNNLDALSGRRSDGDGIVGVYRVEPTPLAPSGGVVVVDKYKRSVPEALGDVLKLGIVFIGQIATLLLLAVGLPAIPIGIIIGIRRARAISRPISDLARAGQALADGDLSARVYEIKSEDEIGQLLRGFNGMAESFQAVVQQEAEERTRAEQALAANRDLVANVSHELRTPVALIRGHLEALESDPSELDRAVRVALRETDRLERLVDELFELTRLESRQAQLDVAPFDAGAAVQAVAESIGDAVRREAGVSLKAVVEPGELRCLGDRLRFEQVVLNLVRNAVRYTPEGGIILVTAARRADVVDVVVRDTGQGIDPEDLPHIFDRFYRADQSRARSTGGAGLGLAIAKELVGAMGGTISVESELDEGTAFTISLPAAPSPRANGNVRVAQSTSA